jgi:hypothetical protein
MKWEEYDNVCEIVRELLSWESSPVDMLALTGDDEDYERNNRSPISDITRAG